MSAKQASLARKNLDKRLDSLRSQGIITPARGWTKAIRESLGMTTRQLAERMGVAPSRVTTIEKAEVAGGVTLKTLRETAEALNCELVYAFVPTKPLNEILTAQAERQARNQIMHMHHTMRLENQGMTEEDLQMETRRIIDDYLTNATRRLWNKE